MTSRDSKKSMHVGGVAEVIEHLPRKHEALSSNPSTAEKRNSKKSVREDLDLKIIRQEVGGISNPIFSHQPSLHHQGERLSHIGRKNRVSCPISNRK
jgi:hypothetical protein